MPSKKKNHKVAIIMGSQSDYSNNAILQKSTKNIKNKA